MSKMPCQQLDKLTHLLRVALRLHLREDRRTRGHLRLLAGLLLYSQNLFQFLHLQTHLVLYDTLETHELLRSRFPVSL
jgi:hypothetical protein